MPVTLNEFAPDAQKIGQGVVVNQAGWETALENNKQAFASEFVQRSRFVSAFPSSMTPTQFVDSLFTNAGVVPSPTDRSAAINEFGAAANTADLAARARGATRGRERDPDAAGIQPRFCLDAVLRLFEKEPERRPGR